MPDVFLSYKREDRDCAALLAQGLSTAGLTVWWDRDIPAGESWRYTINRHLDDARCVVVLWSEASVTRAGEFVQEEADRARARGVLLPVRIDPVQPPLGFGELQALDLFGWSGNVSDPSFEDVLAAVRAVVAGDGRPQPQRARPRLRRVAWVAAALAGGVGVIGFLADLSGLLPQICRISGARSLCVALSVSGVPTAAEDAIWMSRPKGDCAGLREYLARFPNGAYAAEAARRLQAGETRSAGTSKRETRTLPLTVRSSLASFDTERAARADALDRAPEAARFQCRGYEVDGIRVIGASATVQSWRCVPRDNGSVCGFDGEALCEISIPETQEVCP